jgi:hypothetical protein
LKQKFLQRNLFQKPLKGSILLLLATFLTIFPMHAEEYRGLIIINNLNGTKTVLLGSEGSYLFNDSDSTAIAINYKTYPARGSYNISSFSNEFIIQEKQCRLNDFDRISGEGIYVLAVGIYFNSLSPEAAILRFPDSNNLFGEPDIIWLDRKIPAERLRIDSSGNFYLLGMTESDYERTFGQSLPGDCPLLHKFTPDGIHVYSTLVRHIDPTPDRYSETYKGPILALSNFAVSPEGEAWMLWNNVEIDKTGKNKNSPETDLFYINPAGEVNEADPDPPERGYILTGLIENTDSSEVLFVWKSTSPDTETDTIVTSPEGTTVVKGNFPGRVLSVNNELIITNIKDTKNGIAQQALVMYSYN